jgi:hypothetical protein
MYTPDVSAGQYPDRGRSGAAATTGPRNGSKRSLPVSGGQAFSPRPSPSTSTTSRVATTPNFRGATASSAASASSSPSSSASLYPSLGPFQSPIGTSREARRQTIASAGAMTRRQAPPASQAAGPAAKRRKRVVHETDRIRIESLSPWPSEIARRLRDSTNPKGMACTPHEL